MNLVVYFIKIKNYSGFKKYFQFEPKYIPTSDSIFFEFHALFHSKDDSKPKKNSAQKRFRSFNIWARSEHSISVL